MGSNNSVLPSYDISNCYDHLILSFMSYTILYLLVLPVKLIISHRLVLISSVIYMFTSKCHYSVTVFTVKLVTPILSPLELLIVTSFTQIFNFEINIWNISESICDLFPISKY
jgi:hypothetical protein